MKIAHPKTNIRRTFLEKLYFDFMADTVTIELGFSQQVAAEAESFARYLLGGRKGVIKMTNGNGVSTRETVEGKLNFGHI